MTTAQQDVPNIYEDSNLHLLAQNSSTCFFMIKMSLCPVMHHTLHMKAANYSIPQFMNDWKK